MVKLLQHKPNTLPTIEKDTAKRAQAWDAIATLFLDTELDETTIQYVAQKLNCLGYNEKELDYIFWQEVYPTLIGNLTCLFGNWNGFDTNELTNLITHSEKKAIKIRLAKYLRPSAKLVSKDWNKVKKLLKV